MKFLLVFPSLLGKLEKLLSETMVFLISAARQDKVCMSTIGLRSLKFDAECRLKMTLLFPSQKLGDLPILNAVKGNNNNKSVFVLCNKKYVKSMKML